MNGGMDQTREDSKKTFFHLRFPKKLMKILESCTTGSVSWANGGKTVIFNCPQFEKEYLGVENGFFKTNKLPSFVRQLNKYGFRKFKLGKLEREYSNDFFYKNMDEHLLDAVNRNDSKPRKRPTRKPRVSSNCGRVFKLPLPPTLMIVPVQRSQTDLPTDLDHNSPSQLEQLTPSPSLHEGIGTPEINYDSMEEYLEITPRTEYVRRPRVSELTSTPIVPDLQRDRRPILLRSPIARKCAGSNDHSYVQPSTFSGTGVIVCSESPFCPATPSVTERPGKGSNSADDSMFKLPYPRTPKTPKTPTARVSPVWAKQWMDQHCSPKPHRYHSSGIPKSSVFAHLLVQVSPEFNSRNKEKRARNKNPRKQNGRWATKRQWSEDDVPESPEIPPPKRGRNKDRSYHPGQTIKAPKSVEESLTDITDPNHSNIVEALQTGRFKKLRSGKLICDHHFETKRKKKQERKK